MQVPVVVKELNIAGTPASTSSSASASTTTTTSTQSSATASHISAATNLIGTGKSHTAYTVFYKPRPFLPVIYLAC